MPMKKITSILSIAILLLACTGRENNAAFYDAGVSEQLAEHRKQNISDLRYELSFSIPQERSEAVTGSACISFAVDEPQEVVLDFCELHSLHSVEVNGMLVECELRNEHIILPADCIVQGSNSVSLSFVAGNRALNRNDEFMYTLFVPDRARTAFPCFDQPSLKATFKLSLEIPEQWVAVSNTTIESERVEGGRRHVTFNDTEPLSTYLFSFVAGKLQRQEYCSGGRVITAYHRETDAERVAQLSVIFEQVAASLQWMEEYTGIPYPFAKYDLVILPGFQYGGMEHTGATLYNDGALFLGAHPTLDEELARAQLIAHETAHMWFGDFVTMEWFDDVWTKEVFANYFEALMTEPLFPHVNHRLDWLRSTVAGAISEDRTAGTTPIKKHLDNLNNAGLLYSNIIYDKAPVMLKKLVEIMGEDAFRAGVREYLHRYSYGNATWEELIDILDSKCSANLRSFSEVWVHAEGLPHISFEQFNDTLFVRQRDPLQRGLVWPQRFNVRLAGSKERELEVCITDTLHALPLPPGVRYVLPNSDGRGYGYFRPSAGTVEWLLANWAAIDDELCRQAQLVNLHECYQQGVIPPSKWLASVIEGLAVEENALMASTLCSYLPLPMSEVNDSTVERRLLAMSRSHPLQSVRLLLLRTLVPTALSSPVCNEIYDIWDSASHPLAGETDYMNMAYELALRFPSKYEYIIEKQAARIKNPDRARQFAFISQAVSPSPAVQERLFALLLTPEGRHPEPWAVKALALLCHPLRENVSLKYMRPALDSLQAIQRTNDIFFPTRWARSLLRSRRTARAADELNSFFADNPQYPPLLKSKIMQAAWLLYRAQGVE